MITLIKITESIAAQIKGRWGRNLYIDPVEYEGYGLVLNANVLRDEAFKEIWGLLEDCETVKVSASEQRQMVQTMRESEAEMKERLRAELKEDPELIAEIRATLEGNP